MTRLLAALSISGLLLGQGPPVVRLTAVCGDAELVDFGLVCEEDEPCPVLLELASVEPVGNKIFMAGNLHTAAATLWSVLLVSEDGGANWSEPWPRLRGASLEQVQFADFETGWVAGHTGGALPKDPFLLRTGDGGKVWRKLPVYGEGTVGVVEFYRFESKTNGMLVAQRRGGSLPGKYQRMETRDGGSTWTLREAGEDRPAGSGVIRENWRIRGESKSKTLRVERMEGGKWTGVAAFALEAGLCKPAQPKPDEPPGPPVPGAAREGRD